METFSDEIREIILYGSVARGEADGKSDIDLVVLVENDAGDNVRRTGRFHEALMDLKLEHDVIISLQVFTVHEWNEMKGTPFFRQVEDQDGIRLRQQVA
jgi:predicted nucleotidyltransferase